MRLNFYIYPLNTSIAIGGLCDNTMCYIIEPGRHTKTEFSVGCILGNKGEQLNECIECTSGVLEGLHERAQK